VPVPQRLEVAFQVLNNHVLGGHTVEDGLPHPRSDRNGRLGFWGRFWCPGEGRSGAVVTGWV
jgi:hypothetical protein